MARSLRHLILCAGLLALLSLRPVAASPATFKLYCIGTTADMLYDYEHHPRQVFAGQTSFSAPLPVPSDRKLVFYLQKPAPAPNLPPIRVPQAIATIPGGPGPYVVLLAPGPVPSPDGGDPLPLASLVIDASLAASPAETLHVFNLSKREVVVKFADTLFKLSAGESRVLPYPKGATSWIQIAVSSSSGWLPIIGSPQDTASGTRTSLFLCEYPPIPGRAPPPGLLVRTLVETPPTPEKKVSRMSQSAASLAAQ